MQSHVGESVFITFLIKLAFLLCTWAFAAVLSIIPKVTGILLDSKSLRIFDYSPGAPQGTA